MSYTVTIKYLEGPKEKAERTFMNVHASSNKEAKAWAAAQATVLGIKPTGCEVEENK